MPITRTAIVDDSGAGTDGTVIDNAWKQEFYNQIDAYGRWLDGGYAAGSYSALPPMGWAVEAADLKSNWYRKFGNVLTWSVNITTSSTTGSPSPQLAILIPEGIAPAKLIKSMGKLYSSSTGWVDCELTATPPAAQLVIGKLDGTNFALDTNLVYLYFTVEIPY